MRNGWAAPPRPAGAAPAAALVLLLAWLPALTFLGHWSLERETPGDPHLASVGIHVDPPGLIDHVHVPPAADASAHGEAQNGFAAHAEHGHGGIAAFAAVVPGPTLPRALPVQPVARPVAQERAPAATAAPPLVPPPQAAI